MLGEDIWQISSNKSSFKISTTFSLKDLILLKGNLKISTLFLTVIEFKYIFNSLFISFPP